MSFALLDLFALEKTEPEFCLYSARALADSVALSSSFPLQEAGVTLRVAVEDAQLRCVPVLLESALYNLIDNARKASAPGSGISLEGRAEEESYCFTVRDQGRGIPAEALGRLTEPFYMVDKSRARAQGGAGLGLTLCSEIARAHGGALRFESREGEGTTAYLTIRR